jgi:hypothetical protein
MNYQNTIFTWQRVLQLTGTLLVIAGAAIGSWFGLNQADELGKLGMASQNFKTTTNDKTKRVDNAITETFVHPRFKTPSDVFSPTDDKPNTTATGTTLTSNITPAGWDETTTSLQQMWEVNAASQWVVRAAPLSPPSWRVTGVVQRGDQTQVIVQMDNDTTPKFFRIGDTLPGGAKVVMVASNVIRVINPEVNRKGNRLDVAILDGTFESNIKPATPTIARP